MTERIKLSIDGVDYRLQILRKTRVGEDAPRLVIVGLQPNETAQRVLQTCVKGIQHFTPEPYELWVVDNNSPKDYTDWLLDWPDINVVLNRTEPLPPDGRGLVARLRGKNLQTCWGSYANAIGLEIATHLMDAGSRYLVTLHMDTTPCSTTWLSHLLSKLGNGIAAAGVRMDRGRTPEGVLHVLGFAVDFQLFLQLNLDFFPDLPNFDVGDKVTTGLRAAGYDVYSCANTHSNPELIEKIPRESPFRNLHVDRVFDDEGNVIFLHLGRGVVKASGRHAGSTQPDQWVQFCEECLLSDEVQCQPRTLP